MVFLHVTDVMVRFISDRNLSCVTMDNLDETGYRQKKCLVLKMPRYCLAQNPACRVAAIRFKKNR